MGGVGIAEEVRNGLTGKRREEERQEVEEGMGGEEQGEV